MKNKLKRTIVLMLTVTIYAGIADFSVYADENGSKVIEESVSENEDTYGSQNEIREENGWDKVTTEATYEAEGYRVIFSLSSYWDGGFNADVRVENTMEEVFDDWYIRFPLDNEITNIWNAEIAEHTQGIYIIKNAGWNQDIPAGGSCEFGFSGIGNFVGFPDNYEMLGTRTETDEKEYEIQYIINSDWGTGFTGNVTIHNLTDNVIEDWQISFYFNNEISSLWNGTIVSHEGTHYVVKNAGYNQNIPANGSISFGFTVGTGSSEKQIENMMLEQVAKATQEAIDIIINTSELEKNGNMNCYFVTEKLDALIGTLTDGKNVQSFCYNVKDRNDMVVSSGEIPIKQDWEIKDMGLVIGANIITVEAKSRCGNVYEESIVIMNSNKENMDKTTIDTEDDDKDGINNYFESILGTNKNMEDTDTDGLTDLEELAKVGTNPLEEDTDGNGIPDGDEDFDSDGLSNLEEVKTETNCYVNDSDDDGLTDGEEFLQYGTNPLEEDTDEDGLTDGEEISIGFNPLQKDTDENGTPDGEEFLEQTYLFPISGGNSVLDLVELEMLCKGFLGNQIRIQPMKEDILSNEIDGLVGTPLQIETEAAFETAFLTVSYRKELLGDSKEENLCLVWYNEETGEYQLLEEETILDKENHTLSCYTNHFSTWLVIDKEKWNSKWEAYLEIVKSTHDNQYESLTYEIDGIVHRYQLFEKYGSWQEAEEVCRMAGGYLATIQSEEENQAVYRYICSQGCVSAYIGLSDEKSEGNWEWSNGEEVSYTKWNPGEPNGNRWENYAMYYYKYKDGHWNDGSFNSGNTASDVSIFVCEWEDVEVKKDTDGDGIADYYEENGMILPNGQIVFSDPQKADTDGDGLSDYEEMGGESKQKRIIVRGGEYIVPVWYMESNPNLVDSDGDHYSDDIDIEPMKNNWKEYSIQKKEYIMVENDSASNTTVTYGGNQGFFEGANWFTSDYIIANTGCGTIATCDLFLYEAYQHGGKDTLVNQMLDKGDVIQKEDYMNYVRYMDDCYNMTIRNIGLDGWRMALTVNLYNANVAKVPYRAKWEIGLDDEQMLDKITEMLEKDIPVIITVGPSLKEDVGVWFYKQIVSDDKEYDKNQKEYYQYEIGYGNIVNYHYIVITGMIIDENVASLIKETNVKQQIMLEISSWGKKYYISYDEYRNYVKNQGDSATSSILYMK